MLSNPCTASDLLGIVPKNVREQYMFAKSFPVFDGSDFDEFKALYGQTLVCGFARLYGYPVGIVANNGVLFAESAQKGAHFIELCAQRKSIDLFAKHHRFYGGQAVRDRWNRQARRQDGHRRCLRQGPQTDINRRQLLWRWQLRHVRQSLRPELLFMWPNARISVMGGEQAAGVLAQVRRGQIEASGQAWSAEEEATFKQPIIDDFDAQAHPYYASARLWDDGVINPIDTRRVLGLALSASLNKPIAETRFGVFRM